MGVHGQRPVRIDLDHGRTDEIGFGERRDDALDMVGQPEVVVGEIEDEIAAGLAAKHGVAVGLAVALALLELEQPHPLVLAFELAGDVRSGCRHPVADDQQLELRVRLRQRAAHGRAQGGSVIVTRYDDADEGIAHPARPTSALARGRPASTRSSPSTATVSAASAALERGAGPPSR